MSALTPNMMQGSSEAQNFDLFRLTKAKEVVDLCPNTLRAYAKTGLRIYKCGKAAFVSKSELAAYIRGGSV